MTKTPTRQTKITDNARRRASAAEYQADIAGEIDALERMIIKVVASMRGHAGGDDMTAIDRKLAQLHRMAIRDYPGAPDTGPEIYREHDDRPWHVRFRWSANGSNRHVARCGSREAAIDCFNRQKRD